MSRRKFYLVCNLVLLLVLAQFLAPIIVRAQDDSTESLTIEGTVERIESEHPPGQSIITNATILVENIIDGAYGEHRLIIRYLGGTVGDVTLRVSHEPILAPDMRIQVKLVPIGSGVYSIHNVDSDLRIISSVPTEDFKPRGDAWPDASLPVEVEINPNSGDIAGVAEGGAVRNAINTWNSVTGSYFEFTDGGDTGCTANGSGTDNINCVVWNAGTKPGGSSSALASTYWTTNGKTNTSEFDMIFWEAHTFTIGASKGSYDVETIAVHEFGHALGLNHETCCGGIMEPAISDNTTKRTLADDDRDGIRDIYSITPESLNTYVDSNAAPNNGDCTVGQPCRSALRGIKRVADNGTVHISPGSYASFLTIDRPMTLRTWAPGTVTIGQ